MKSLCASIFQSLRCVALVGAVFAAAFSPAAMAQANYPDKPIRFIVPFPPGGGADKLARALAQKLESQLKTSVVVEHKGGGNGNVALDFLAKAPGDGYTIAMTLTDHIVLNPALFDKLTYDPIKDFAPVALLTSTPFVLAVEAKAGPASFDSMIAAAKKQPESVSIGTSGANTRLTIEQLQKRAGTKFTNVPYQGVAQGMPDLMGGRLTIWVGSIPTLRSHIEGGRVRGIAITSLSRSPVLPNVPTVHESGFPEFEAVSWFGVIAPSATPSVIVDRLNAEINIALKSAEFRTTMEADGALILGGTSAHFQEVLKTDIARIGKIAKEAGVKAN